MWAWRQAGAIPQCIAYSVRGVSELFQLQFYWALSFPLPHSAFDAQQLPRPIDLYL